MPEIAIDNSFLAERARDYAALSDLAYADWTYDGQVWVPDASYNKIWEDLHAKGYRVLIQKPNDSTTGYSGTLFEGPADSDGIRHRILANRGIDPAVDAQDRKAILQLSNGEMPSSQFYSMMKFIEELQLKEQKGVRS